MGTFIVDIQKPDPRLSELIHAAEHGGDVIAAPSCIRPPGAALVTSRC